MAEDFPAEKYEFKATPEVRSFREVIIHAMSGTQNRERAPAQLPLLELGVFLRRQTYQPPGGESETYN